jgi:hypothetical protein
MELRQRCARVAVRCRAFYAARTPGHFLIQLHVPYQAPAIPPLYSFDLDRQLGEWLDHKLAVARALWQSTAGLDDDALPNACPHFGIAEHAAWLGLQVHLQEWTCLPAPLLQDPADLERLRLSTTTPWFRYMKEGYEHLRKRADGTFVLSSRGTVMPMDLANFLRGDALFVDFLTDKPFAHRLLAFCQRAIAWYYPQILSWCDPVEGGYFFLFHNSWMDAGALAHVSNDAALLCSPAVYDEFGYPYEEPLCAAHSGVYYHVHNQKMHFVPRAAALPHMALLEVSNDPKTVDPVEDLAHILPLTGHANLELHLTSDQVRAHIEDLKVRNVFLDVTCRDYADAADVLALVRARDAG